MNALLHAGASPTISSALSHAEAALAAAGVPDAGFDAACLVAHALEIPRFRLHPDRQRPVTAGELRGIEEHLARRASREPLQYILGTQPFRRITLGVAPGALIPRPETEEVMDVVLKAAQRVWRRMPGACRALHALDLGTGSGCMAIAFADEWPGARVVASDISRAALGIARANIRRAGVEARVRLVAGDLFAPFGASRFPLIFSNPPYLTRAEWETTAPEIRGHEPSTAFLGGEDGLLFYRRIFREAPAHLDPLGAVVVEIGATQGQAVADIARAAGFGRVNVTQDLAGRDRVVTAELPFC